MISSMTGFGRFENIGENRKITVEVKSVNHKFLDISTRMPRKFNSLEMKIRNLLKEYAVRGKIDIYISCENLKDNREVLKYNKYLAGEYYNNYLEMKRDFDLQGDIGISLIGRSPDVFTVTEEEEDEETLWRDLEPVLVGAFSAFKESRIEEGEALGKNISGKLDEMTRHVAFIEKKLPDIVAEFKEKITGRLKELIEGGAVDEGRIAAEVTMYADKTAVDEEVVRLQTHISHMRKLLEEGGEIGRNLDFIAQEMNRESNTILSKSSDMEVTDRGILLKTCIEKIREQVQNIE